MKRLLPRSLFAQMLLILLAGMAVSHIVGSLIYASDQARAVRAIGGYAAAQRISNLARLLDETPPAWRSRIAAAASDASLRVTLSARPPDFAGATANTTAAAVRRYLAAQLPQALGARLRVAVSSAAASWQPPPASPMARMMAAMQRSMPTAGSHAMTMAGPHAMTMAGPQGNGSPMDALPGDRPSFAGLPPWMAGGTALPRLRATLQLSDGAWLSFMTALPDAAPSVPWPFAAAMATMTVVVVLASAWAVRRVTAPLRTLAGAAERLGRDVNAPPLAETGTTEMRQAAQSFNQMQARIRLLLDNRTRMLAALSHDLRTPLTLLRLRTETLAEDEDRERMLATIGELDAMVGASLAFARDQASAEPWRRTDLAALLASIVDDMADAGLPVTMAPADSVVLSCQPVALRRALSNLLDNAMKYGGTARVAIQATPPAVRITIDDDGPGIPEAEQQRVFEPFHRLESSRSRETGGTGLGLSIAQTVVQAHGGGIVLSNRPKGGLRATVTLPC